MARHLRLLCCFSAWFSAANSLGDDLFPRALTGDICRVWAHQSALLQDWIYIDFSYATFTDGVAGLREYRLNPFGIDITKPFDTSYSSDTYFAIPSDPNVPGTIRGALWVDRHERIYKYGGYFPEKALWTNPRHNLDIRPSELWALEPVNRTWSRLPPPAGDAVAGARSGGSAFSAELGLGFYAGGMLENVTDSRFANWTDREIFVLNTLLTYDMEGNSFANTTTPFDPVLLNSLVYVPVGPEGILLSLSGRTVSHGMYNQTIDPRPVLDLDFIRIYDIGKKRWYVQRTSGAVPRDRHSFCTAVAAAGDNSSYSIIMHGGRSTYDREAFSDTFVLSIPSFEFLLANDGVGQVRRLDHTCHLRGNKMFVLGGRDLDQDMPGWGNASSSGACDPRGLVNVLDVNTFSWDAEYDPREAGEYLVHESIYRVIGGNEHGCAARAEPEMGWGTAKSELRELFGTRSNCSVPSAGEPGMAGGRPRAEGCVVAMAVFAAAVSWLC